MWCWVFWMNPFGGFDCWSSPSTFGKCFVIWLYNRAGRCCNFKTPIFIFKQLYSTYSSFGVCCFIMFDKEFEFLLSLGIRILSQLSQYNHNYNTILILELISKFQYFNINFGKSQYWYFKIFAMQTNVKRCDAFCIYSVYCRLMLSPNFCFLSLNKTTKVVVQH